MIRKLLFLALLGVISLATLWRFPEFPGPFGIPDGFLLVLLAWAFSQNRPLPASQPLGFGASLGLLKDLTGTGLFGGWMVALAFVTWLALQGTRTLECDHPLAQLLWVTLFAMAATGIQMLLLGMSDGRLAWGALFGYHWIPSSLLTGLFSLAAFPLIKSVLGTPRAPGLA
ncbi:MAG: rod shape-determining protein MreD [Candidatus Omnitrophica bacterium]|nr:rod shape-determining protein MreD [Candidatus Omnitrophota bacterium]